MAVSDYKNYSNIGQMLEYWVDKIAPNYFDFQVTNNYRTGTFGYINNIMSEVTGDSFNAINIARREFYPVTAQNIQSLYKMAALHKLDVPMYTPATAEVVLVLKESDVVSSVNGTMADGLSEFVLDDTLLVLADNIPFMLDYPIKIISKKSGNKWIHTTHYDINKSNSLNDNPNKYLKNKTIRYAGENHLLIIVKMHQVEMQTETQVITQNATIDTVSLDFSFTGNLANFEVFYKENDTTQTIQLRKIIENGLYGDEKFCYYRMVNDNTIRIIFPHNSYFTPKFNSEIMINIYTTLGEDGNFESFNGSILASSQSEDYPYNSDLVISGIINGSSAGGYNRLSTEEFRAKVLNAYSTNNTITTNNDLQIYFDELNTSNTDKIVVSKKRDDVFMRLYGAFTLLKDSDSNIMPTNTLDLLVNHSTDMAKSDFDSQYLSSNRVLIKPGSLIQYNTDIDETESVYFKTILDNYFSTARNEILKVYNSATNQIKTIEENNAESFSDYTVRKNRSLNIVDNLDEFDGENDFLFTNPFLISVTLNPNVVGYYINSLNDIYAIEYSNIYDNSLIQFLASNLRITRNALMGENYYKLSVSISPSTDLEYGEVVELVDTEDEANIIRAQDSGYVKSIQYDTDTVYADVQYDNGLHEVIKVGSHVENFLAYTSIKENITVPSGNILDISFSNDSNYLVMTHDEAPYITLYKRNGDIFNKVSLSSPFETTVDQCEFSPDGSLLAVSSKDSPYLTVYTKIDDIFAKIKLNNLTITSAIKSMKYTQDGKNLILTFDEDPFCIIYNFEAASVRTPIYEHVNYVDVSADNTFLGYIDRDNKLKFINIINNTEMDSSSLNYIGGNITTFKFSPDNNYIAIAIDAAPYIRIYNINTQQQLTLDNEITEPIKNIYFSNNGIYLYTTFSSGSTYIKSFKLNGSEYMEIDAIEATNDIKMCDISLNSSYLAILYESDPYIDIFRGDATKFTYYQDMI